MAMLANQSREKTAGPAPRHCTAGLVPHVQQRPTRPRRPFPLITGALSASDHV